MFKVMNDSLDLLVYFVQKNNSILFSVLIT